MLLRTRFVLLLILNEVAVLGRVWLCYLSLGCATLGMVGWLVGGWADTFREDNGGQMLGEGLYNAEPEQAQLADLIQITCNLQFIMLQSNWATDMYE